MSGGTIWEGIKNRLTGLGTGIGNTFGSLPSYASRGWDVAAYNNELVQAIADKARMGGIRDEALRKAYKDRVPVIPNVPLADPMPAEADLWLKQVDASGNPVRLKGTHYEDDPALYYYDRAAAHLGRYPWQTAGVAVGGYALDQWLNKPVEGLVDTLTFNALNLRPDERTQQSDVFYPAVPTLTAEDLAYQIKRQQGNMAISALTLQQLQRLQQLQNGQSLQQLQPIEYGY
jgi:hypothetical protein